MITDRITPLKFLKYSRFRDFCPKNIFWHNYFLIKFKEIVYKYRNKI